MSFHTLHHARMVAPSSAEDPTRPTVLRDVVVQGQVALTRPGVSDMRFRGTPPSGAIKGQESTCAPTAKAAPGLSKDALAEDEARRRGHEEGFAKGYAEALAQAAEEARKAAELAARRGTQELEERAKRLSQELTQKSQAADRARFETLDALIQALPAQIDARLDASQDDMLALCFEAICRVLGEHAIQRDVVRAHLAHAIQGLRGRRLVAVHLHPDDMAAIQLEPGVTSRARLGGDAVQWVADPGIALGGCILQSPEGGLDARFDTQLHTLRNVLLQSRTSVRPAEA